MLIGLFILQPTCSQTESPVTIDGSKTQARFDHHVHLLSPHLVRDWKSLGVPFSRPDDFYSSASTVLEQRKIDKAFILSMAYLYGSRWFQQIESHSEKEHEWVRRENDFIASVVRAAPNRLVGFGSVHPLRPYALTEIRRFHDELGLVGLKLHLYNSGIDLTHKDHLERLRQIFALAEEKAMPVILHLNAIEGDSRKENVDILIRELIGKHPRSQIYIAHLGGSGGYSGRVGEVLNAFISHLDKGGALEDREIFFEMSAVVLKETSEEVEPPGEERLRQLAFDLRRLGLHRVLFGSDHPVFNPQEYAETLQQKMNMKAEEIQQILSNEAPALKPLR